MQWLKISVFCRNDWPHMLDGPEYFIMLPMFCYLVAYCCVLLVAFGVWYLIITSGNAVHAIFLRWVFSLSFSHVNYLFFYVLFSRMLTTRFANWTNLKSMPDKLADMAFDFTFGKFPVLIAVFLISMTLATCGGFGLFMGSCFFIIKVFILLFV